MKTLLALTTHYPGPAIRILEAAWVAAAKSGADDIRLFTVGNTPPVPLEFADAHRVHIGPNRGHQEGERDLMIAAISYAEANGFSWIIKSACDCIHTANGWALEWVAAAKGMEATIIGDRWPERHNWRASGSTDALLRVMPQTKVFAGSTKFLRATWPLVDSGFLERDFEIRIRESGNWPLVRLIAADEVEATGGGSQEFWNAKSGPLRFAHCHSVGELPNG